VRQFPTLLLSRLVVAVCCGVAVSQTSNSLPPQSQPKGWASVACNPPSRATTSVAASLIAPNQDSTLQSYLEGSVLPIVRANWYRLTSKSSEPTGGDATVQFTIAKDGSISSARLRDGVGHATLGDLALNAVSKSGPLPPLPTDSAGPVVAVATFSYEPAAKDLSTTWPRPPRYSHVCSSDETSKGSVDCLTPPKATFSPEPEFTEAARRNMTQGNVMVRMMVSADGTVSRACAEQPLGDGLDQTAVETVRTWKFEPAVINNQRSEAQLEIEVDFRLQLKADGLSTAPSVVPGGAGHSTPTVTAQIVKAPSPCVTAANGCVTPPRLVLSPMRSDLPGSSESIKYSGTATLQLTVSTDGVPEDIKVLMSLGPGLDNKAITAVQGWKCVPAQKDGKPVATQIVVEVEFHLK
jgi:TonB family protein